MELPARLREAVDAALDGARLDELAPAVEALSVRYRAEVRDGRFHVDDALSARAYAAARLPATYAAIRTSLEAVAVVQPEFAPVTALDVGAGPGSAVWAAADRWPSLTQAALVEGSAAFRAFGEELAGGLPVRTAWRKEDATGGLPGAEPADLVTLAYVLDEIAPETRDGLVARLWELTRGVLVLVEPGTPAGWRRILAARTALIQAGAKPLAPCPHAAACPLTAPDWCHFARRVSRSRLHRLSKGGDVPWEDEKFIYFAAGRLAGTAPAARVLAPPRSASGRVWLELCEADGSARERLFTRRDGPAFAQARRTDWGQGFRPCQNPTDGRCCHPSPP